MVVSLYSVGVSKPSTGSVLYATLTFALAAINSAGGTEVCVVFVPFVPVHTMIGVPPNATRPIIPHDIFLLGHGL